MIKRGQIGGVAERDERRSAKDAKAKSKTQFRRDATLATFDLSNMAAMTTGQALPSGKIIEKY